MAIEVMEKRIDTLISKIERARKLGDDIVVDILSARLENLSRVYQNRFE